LWRFNAIVPLESAEERGQGYRCAITFNEDPNRRKIWPGSKNFPNFNPSFETGYAEEKSGNFRPVTSCRSGKEQIKGRGTPHRDCGRGQEGARIEKRKEGRSQENRQVNHK